MTLCCEIHRLCITMFSDIKCKPASIDAAIMFSMNLRIIGVTNPVMLSDIIY